MTQFSVTPLLELSSLDSHYSAHVPKNCYHLLNFTPWALLLLTFALFVNVIYTGFRAHYEKRLDDYYCLSGPASHTCLASIEDV